MVDERKNLLFCDESHRAQGSSVRIFERAATGRGVHPGRASALGVREVWRYRRNALRIYQLRSDGQYLEVKRSAVLPMLSAADVLRFISMRGSLGETRIVRAFRAWVRERLERPA